MKFHNNDDSTRGSAHGWNNLLLSPYEQLNTNITQIDVKQAPQLYAEVRWVVILM